MEKKLVSFRIKETPPPETRQKIEDLLFRKIKGTIVKDKSKEKKGRWIIKLKKEELLTVEAMEAIVKKAGAKKMLRDISIGDAGDGEGD